MASKLGKINSDNCTAEHHSIASAADATTVQRWQTPATTSKDNGTTTMPAAAIESQAAAEQLNRVNNDDEHADADEPSDPSDEVDHCAHYMTANRKTSDADASASPASLSTLQRTSKRALAMLQQQKTATTDQPRRKSSFPTLELLPLLQQFRRRGGSAPAIHSINPRRKDVPPFVKSSSIARLFGNTYSTSATASDASPAAAASAHKATGSSGMAPSHQKSAPIVERFHSCPEDDSRLYDERALWAGDEAGRPDAGSSEQRRSSAASQTSSMANIYGDDDAEAAVNPLRTLSRGLGRLFFKKSYSVKISEPDPEFKVAYLGNVLTGWAKGDSCMEKPLATLWRNYTQNTKPDVSMRVRICPSGLKATTRQHGLTEYWSHRITFCSAPRNYPKVFCWIYRHEGRKLKHELRCHAVLCTKESVADNIAEILQDNLSRALREFKREKMNKQNARLSLVNSVYENPSMPQRKIMLSVGGNNYRPPLERSKSAPRLMVIEETGEEPDDEDDRCAEMDAGTLRAQRPPCCTVDPLYPAMTLGRRKCRRGHSIRRTGNRHPVASIVRSTSRAKPAAPDGVRFSDDVVVVNAHGTADEQPAVRPAQPPIVCRDRLRSSSSDTGGSGDDLDKLLAGSDYDSQSPLANELLSYFDMKFKRNSTSTTADEDDDDAVEIRRHRSPLLPVRTSLSLDNLDAYGYDCGAYGNDDDDEDDEDDRVRHHRIRHNHHHRNAAYFSQSDILSTLNRLSLGGNAGGHQHQDSGYAADPAIDRPTPDDEPPSGLAQAANAGAPVGHQTPPFDSDEGSISSGFETVSTATTNAGPDTAQTSLDCVGSPLATGQQSASADASPAFMHHHMQRPRCYTNAGKQAANSFSSSDDSEHSDVSDESGYVEYRHQRMARASVELLMNGDAIGSAASGDPIGDPAAGIKCSRITIDIVDRPEPVS